jgi:hypothetical protein
MVVKWKPYYAGPCAEFPIQPGLIFKVRIMTQHQFAYSSDIFMVAAPEHIT